MEECVIILPTTIHYIDVCETFVQLMRKYWKKCKYKVIISVVGNYEDKRHLFQGYELLVNDEKDTLPTCILKATDKYKAKYYLCMLGDAFITCDFREDIFLEIINIMRTKGIEYCSILPVKHASKTKECSKYCRYINLRDRYSFSFVAYIATESFIKREFCDNITDIDFEMKHLVVAENSKDDCYEMKAIGVLKNYFSIYPGIKKGKWDRNVYRKIKKGNPDIVLAERPQLSYKAMLYIYLAEHFSFMVSGGLRKKIKKLLQWMCP